MKKGNGTGMELFFDHFLAHLRFTWAYCSLFATGMNSYCKCWSICFFNFCSLSFPSVSFHCRLLAVLFLLPSKDGCTKLISIHIYAICNGLNFLKHLFYCLWYFLAISFCWPIAFTQICFRSSKFETTKAKNISTKAIITSNKSKTKTKSKRFTENKFKIPRSNAVDWLKRIFAMEVNQFSIGNPRMCHAFNFLCSSECIRLCFGKLNTLHCSSNRWVDAWHSNQPQSKIYIHFYS